MLSRLPQSYKTTANPTAATITPANALPPNFLAPLLLADPELVLVAALPVPVALFATLVYIVVDPTVVEYVRELEV